MIGDEWEVGREDVRWRVLAWVVVGDEWEVGSGEGGGEDGRSEKPA